MLTQEVLYVQVLSVDMSLQVELRSVGLAAIRGHTAVQKYQVFFHIYIRVYVVDWLASLWVK